jgi:hypothetical protein
MGQGWEISMERRRYVTRVALGIWLGLGAAFVGVGPAKAVEAPDVSQFVGNAIGFGQVVVAPGRLNSFRFVLDTKTVGHLVPGQIQFRDPLAGITLVSQQVTFAALGSNEVEVEGICTVNGLPGVFQMEAFDAAAPAAGNPLTGHPGVTDHFFLCYETLFDSSCAGGVVRGGNVIVRLAGPPVPTAQNR